MGEIKLKEGQTLTAHDIDRINEAVKAEIKAAEDKRGKEVLEMAKQTIRDNATNWGPLMNDLDKDYKKRFNDQE